MVPGDGDGVPLGNVIAAEVEDIRDETHGRLGGKIYVPRAMYP
jgi:hypothetical protein